MVFTTIFVILLSFLIIFAESQLIFYVGGVLGVLYLSQIKNINFKQIALIKKNNPNFYRALLISLFSILILLFYLPLNAYWGIAWSQSLTRYFSLLIGFSSFIVFLFYDRKLLTDEKVLFNKLFTLMQIFSVLALILMVFPSLGALLPKTNLLYASYGHNHFATLLLLFLPYFWQKIILKEKMKNKSEPYWLLFFYIILFLSFARVAIVLALLQILTLIFFNIRQLRKLSLSKQKLLRNLGYFLSLVLVFLTVFVLQASSSPSQFCKNKDSTFQHFCKDVTQDDRLIYWKHAVDFFRQKPLIGHGLNSFVLVFRNQAKSDISVARYTHNEFLQILTDTGLIGSILFFIPFFIFLTSSIIRVFKKPFSRNQALVLGVLASYLIVVFDFDWQFTAVFSLSLIFVALILRQNLPLSKQSRANNTHSRSFLSVIAYLIFCISSILLIVISFTHLASKLSKKIFTADQTFILFPLLENPDYSASINALSKENQNLILNIYKNDANFLSNYFEYTNDKNLQKKIYLQLLNVNPRFVAKVDFFEFLMESGLWTWEERVEILLKIAYWANEEASYLENKNLAINIKYKTIIGSLLLEMADEAFVINEWQLAGKLYYQYYLLNIWQPDDYEPVFLEFDGQVEHSDFLKEFLQLDTDLFFQNYEPFYRFYADVLIDLFFSLDYVDFKVLADRFVGSKFQEKFYDFSQDLMRPLIKELGTDIKINQERKQWLIANFMHFFIENPDNPWSWEEKEKLAKKLWSFYRQLELSEPANAGRYKEDALILAPEIAWELSQIQ
jgi:O-antigen ligase